MIGETISVTRQGADTGSFDAQGAPVRSAPITFSIEGVAVAPTGSTESATLVGDTAITGYTLYLPTGTVLLKQDSITVRGVTGWQVDGDAAAGQWTSPFTNTGWGVEVKVSRGS